jgi:hypothetical protein
MSLSWLKLPTTSSWNAHTARLHRALSGLLFDVHSLPRGKERTKKARQGVPPWNPLSVPHGMDKDEI